MSFTSMNTRGFESPEKYRDHQRGLVCGVMRVEGWTTHQMADYLGIDEHSLKQWLHGGSIMSVEARITRWSSIPVCQWDRAKIA